MSFESVVSEVRNRVVPDDDEREALESVVAELSARAESAIAECAVDADTRLVEDVDGAIAFREEMLDQRDDLDYELDGTVVKLDRKDACATLGSTSQAPRWAFAYKFPARSEETTVRDVVVQVGRTGRLTPVALLDPVDVSGVEVSRATLHNPDQIEDLGVDVGDRVRLTRAGDVIPYIEAVLDADADDHFGFPDHCPVCDSPIERDGPMAFCTGGVACTAQQIGRAHV